ARLTRRLRRRRLPSPVSGGSHILDRGGPMDADYFRTLFDYQYWARDKLLAEVDRLTETDYIAPRPMDYGSIHGTLVHIYAGEVVWHSRWNGTSPARLLGPADVPDLGTLTALWQQHEAMVRR